MTEQQIIEWDNTATELATEQFPDKVDSDDWWIKHCIEFAKLVAAHQRKRCAKVCSDVSNKSGGEQYDMFGNNLAEQCENAIRALKD